MQQEIFVDEVQYKAPIAHFPAQPGRRAFYSLEDTRAAKKTVIAGMTGRSKIVRPNSLIVELKVF
jgi:hypothetical protein